MTTYQDEENKAKKRLFHLGGGRPARTRDADRGPVIPPSLRPPSQQNDKSAQSDTTRPPMPHRTETGGNTPPPPRGVDPRRIRLPFEERRNKDVSEWIYRHRVGLLVTVVLYLVAGIMFLSYKIVVRDNVAATVYMELVNPEEPEPPKEPEDQQKQLERMQQQSYEDVQNARSNENAKLNASLKDDRSSQAQNIYDEAQKVQQKLAAGQKAFQQGLDEVRAISQGAKNKSSDNASDKSGAKSEDVKVQGNVTVSYSLEGRSARYLHVPAYQCEGAGTVVVTITVNRNGDVTDAFASKSTAGSDSCITEMAVKAATASSFSASSSAPDKQKGTITYVFIAQ